MKLDITIERTIWCAECAQWEQQSAPRLKPFIKKMRAQGWRIKQGRTLCKKCADEHHKKTIFKLI